MKYKNALLIVIVFSGCLACSEAGLDQPDASMAMPGQGGFQGIAGDIVRPGTDQGTIPQYTDKGASSADTDAPRMAITIPIPPTLAADTATTVCAYLQRCNYTEIAEEVLNEPCQQVIERQMEDAVVNRLSPLQELGMLSFNPQGNRACLSAIEALPCSLDFTSLSQACEDGFDGLLEEGAPCTEHEACAGNAYCARENGCPGRCQTRSEIGQACQEDAGCVTGTTCVRGACQGPSALNGECGGNGPPCAAGLYCTGENGSAGRCATYQSTPAARGADCDINGGPLCTNGFACVVDAGLFGVRFRCEDRRDEGQRCRPGLPDQCRRGLYCADTDIDAQDIEGVCRLAPGEGERCGQGPVFEVCAAGGVCDGGVCAFRSRLGESCAQDETCYSGSCENNLCVPGHLCPL